MSCNLRVFLLGSGVCAVAMIAACAKPLADNSCARQPIPGDSIVRYATDEFVAACRVRPKELIKHPYFGSLPIDTFLPGPLSLGKLDAMDVEELVVLCGPASDRTEDRGKQADLQWAAVARTSQPIDLQMAIRQWRQSLVPQDQEPDARPKPATINGHRCFQVGAGTFLAPARSYGKLRFTGVDGRSAERGANIGNVYEYRSYIEGATKSSAIFSFEQLDQACLIEGMLPLELRPDVFFTRWQERATAQIEVRNPDTGLCSQSITLEMQSHANHKLNVPRKLNAVDGTGGRPADLLKDFVSHGRLEVVLKVNEPMTYVGVGQYDLYLRRQAFEYIFVSDREIVIAQSADTLKKMLAVATAPAPLASQLSEADADIVVAVAVRDRPQRTALERFMHAIDHGPLAILLGEALTNMTGTVSVNEQPVARVTADFVDHQAAGKAVRQLNETMRSATDRAPTFIRDSLGRLDTGGSLSSLGLGIAMGFPSDRAMALARHGELLAMIDDSWENLDIEADGKEVNLEWRQPASLSQLSAAGQFALANMEEVLARDLFARERFDLGEEMFKRVTDRFPHAPQAWFRRAHHLSYNTSVRFVGSEHRYAWVRRGVEVLLDGVEQNPETTDLIWIAGRFIGWKIGDVDERIRYRELFSQDERLQQRIARIVDLRSARSPDDKIDNWLVARLLFEHCIEQQAKSSASSTASPPLFFSRPAAAQAGYAQSLSEAGHWSEALQAWKEAERMHVELGDRVPEEAARKRIQYDYWLTRCRLEQHSTVQLARKLSQAAEHLRVSEPEQARDLYRQSLEVLSAVREQHPTQMAQLAGEFQHLAAGYRKVAKQLADTSEVPSILTWIEHSQPVSRQPLLDLPTADK